MTDRAAVQPIRSGLAQVCTVASQFHVLFANGGYRGRDMEGIIELPIGTTVLVLREQALDAGWAPVIFIEGIAGTSLGTACFSWVHPDTIRMYDPPHPSATITVGHCGQRGRKEATHNIGRIETGARWSAGYFILDARWSGRGESDERCAGYCSAVMAHTASSPTRTADILRFATERIAGSVVCQRGKHRSVSAAKILELCFDRNVDYTFAARNHYCPCNSIGNASHVYEAFRGLPPPRQATSLAQATGLMP